MATSRLCQVSARGLASERDSRGATGWPGQQSNGYFRPTVPGTRPSALRDSVFGSESPLPHQTSLTLAKRRVSLRLASQLGSGLWLPVQNHRDRRRDDVVDQPIHQEPLAIRRDHVLSLASRHSTHVSLE